MTCYTALITPFDREGHLDEEGFAHNLERQHPVDGVVVLGTTGEAPTLTLDEKKRLLTLARTSSLPIMAGCGAYSTTQTVTNLKLAADCGADSALVITPYYNKPTQEGLFQHFQALAKSSPLPIVVYNNPSRTSCNLTPETLKRLAALPQIVGVKEANGNLMQLTEVVALKQKFPEFQVYAGDDILTLPLMAMGGDGVISTISNLVPEMMKGLVTACQGGNFERARGLNGELLPLIQKAGCATNPIPIKAMMVEAGLPSGIPRLPLTPLEALP